MRLNQRMYEVEKAASALTFKDYVRYLEFEEHRSRHSTLLFLLMAVSAFAASVAASPRLTEPHTDALLLAGLAMTLCLLLMACSRRYVFGAVARVAFLFWCAHAFSLLIEDSRHMLFWQLAICATLLVAMSPLHYEPLSHWVAVLWVLHRSLEPQLTAILDHPEAGWMFCLVATSALFGVVMNAHFFLTRTRLYKVSRELTEMAYRDGLTKISNRRGFVEDFRRLSSSEPPRPMALLLLDADDFKSINDRRGHDVGDEVLKAIACTLAQARGALSCGRLGGEEFAVLAHGDQAEAISLAAALNERIAALDVQGVRFTVSIGIAPVAAGVRFESAMRMADQALYQAKRNGKNRAVFASTATAQVPPQTGGRA